jgi:two-component system NtrC family sensor kinase
MKRTVLASLLAIAALGLLVAFALKSQSVPVDAHVAQHTLSIEVERVVEDFPTLISTLEAAWRESQSPGDALAAIRERLSESPAMLRREVAHISGGAAQTTRIQNSIDGFTQMMQAADELARDLIETQAAYGQSYAYLRDSGPNIIQRMREIALERAAADTFQLVVGTVDFAEPESTVQANDLWRLHAMLNRDQRLDANMPTQVDLLLASAATILDSKTAIRSKLNQLSGTPIVAAAQNLGVAVNDTYDSAVAAADSARLMLTVYAIVLLLAVGFVALRLQASFAETNSANFELASLNESLEQRVTERTEELSSALANLKESQVQLVQAEKMSSLGQLVAGISHEINTPLLYLANNAVLISERIALLGEYVQQSAAAFALDRSAYADRKDYQTKFIALLLDLKKKLREDELESAIEETQDLMKDSIEGLGDLTEMAQSLKDFSRLDRAPVGSFNVNSGIEKTLTITRNIVRQKAEVHKFFGDVPEIQCSPSKINQVFMNLITNAAQAIRKRGEIVITTSQVDSDYVSIAISDTGCGISAENLGKIRDPFFTTKEVGAGTGLGLSIVEEIIRSHGGELKVESRVNEGSVFTVLLPIRQSDADSHQDDANHASIEIPIEPELTEDDGPAFAEAV